MVRGYRSLKELVWQPGSLNVLIGPNGSGKSNLLRAIKLLRSAALGNLEKSIVEQGGTGVLLWDGTSKGLEWILDVEADSRGLRRLSSRSPRNIRYELALTRFGFLANYGIQHELLGDFTKVEVGLQEQPFKYLERDTGSAVLFDHEQKKLIAPERIEASETLLSQTAKGLQSPDLFFSIDI